jgi:hypothetical protein
LTPTRDGAREMLMRFQLAVLVLFSGCLRPTQELSPPHACTAAEFPPPFQSCGGDVTGDWRLSCYQVPSDRFTMTAAPVEHWSFKSDGQYVFSAENDYALTVSSSSAPDDGGCAHYNEGAPMFGGTCTDAGLDECRCDYSAGGLANTGSYSTSGDTLRRTYVPRPNALPVTEGAEYCVSGETLTMGTRFGNFLGAGVFVRE